MRYSNRRRLSCTVLAPGVPHAYAYLPDLAETFAQLLDRPDRLSPFECIQFEGLWDADGGKMVEAIRTVVGRNVPERAFPRWLLRLAAPLGGFAPAKMTSRDVAAACANGFTRMPRSVSHLPSPGSSPQRSTSLVTAGMSAGSAT